MAEARRFPNRKRPRRDGQARFKERTVKQLDFLRGCVDAQVPSDHLARAVVKLLEQLDLSQVESEYSSLGQHGFHPRHVLGALVYGSLIGLHHSTKLGKAMQTDAALQFAAGGHIISAGRLRAFRRERAELFAHAIEQTIALAVERDLVDTAHLAIDSVRLRAHASTKAARTLKRSKKRLAELAAIEVDKLSPEERTLVETKRKKHEESIATCEERDRTNVVMTNPSAGLLKFPSGAAAPGHRVTMTAVGVKERLVVDVFIDADAHDYGKLGAAMERCRSLFERVGASVERMQVAADAGYYSDRDLVFASDNRQWVDVLIAERQQTYRGSTDKTPLFPPHAFHIDDKRIATCPAGTTMEGPFRDGKAARYHGVGCSSCELKPKCTKGQRKYLTINPQYLDRRRAMEQRMAQPGASERYAERMATIEPVFASIQADMGFRRLSSREAKSIRAEILLKVLSHNIQRLIACARRLLCVRITAAWVATPDVQN